MNWRALQQELTAGKRSQLYLLHGEDEWQIGQAITSLTRIVPPELRELNVYRVIGKNLRPIDMEQYLQGSLFGDERLLILDEPRFFRAGKRGEDSEDTTASSSNSKRDSKEDASDEARWQKALELLCQELVVVLVCPGGADKRRRMYKWLEKQGVVVECAPLKRGEMVNLIQTVMRQYGLEAEYGVAERIQEIAGELPGVAVQEITKLSAAFPERKRLTVNEVVPVLSTSVDAEIFELFDLLAERRLAEVFELLDELVRRGEAVPRIVAALARQLRQMLRLRSLATKGVRGEAAARQLGIHPYMAQRLNEKAAQLQDQDLMRLLAECAEKDSLMKRGRLGMEAGLQVLFLHLVDAMKPARRQA